MNLSEKAVFHDFSIAFQGMALDILGSVLGKADNPAQLGAYLTQKIRELTGARTVVLWQCLNSFGKAGHRIICANPHRRVALAEKITQSRLPEILHDSPGPKIWKAEAQTGEVEKRLFDLQCGLSMSMPLQVGTVRVGAMLLLDLPDVERIYPVLDFLGMLSTVVALVFRNALLLEAQESIIQKRTKALRNKSDQLQHELKERKRREQVLAARLRLSEYSATHTVEEVLQRLLDETEMLTDSSIGFFHFLSPDQETLTLQLYSTKTLMRMCAVAGNTFHKSISKAGAWVDAVKQRRAVINNDYRSPSNRNGLPKGHAPVHRMLVVPVFREDRIVAILGVGNKENEYVEEDVKTVVEIADMAWDIILRKQFEEKLKNSEARYREIVEGTDNLVTEVDTNGRFIFVNEASRKVFGLSPQECIGRMAFDFIYPPDRERTRRHFVNWIENKQADVAFENRQINPKGQLRDMLWSINLNFDDQGAITSIKSIARDITDRKKAEAALQISNARFQRIFKSETIGIVMANLNGQFVEANDAFLLMTGYGRKDLPLNGYAMTPSRWAEQDHRMIQQIRESGLVPAFEKEFRCADGSHLPVTIVGVQLKEEGEKILCFILDQTERKQAEAELTQYRNHLEELVEERTVELIKANNQLQKEIMERKKAETELRQYADTQAVLVREVNHRVKNNLSAIISMLHMEQDRAEGVVLYFSVLRDLVSRIEGLSTVHSLLSASGWRPLTVDDLCRQVVNAALQGVPLEKHINVKITPSRVRINSNQAHHLTLIINELTTNSIKYALKKRETAFILIEIHQGDQMVEILFRDDGPGYPDHILKNSFIAAGIGFELIRGITRRSLRGDVSFSNENGAVASIYFKNELQPRKEERK